MTTAVPISLVVSGEHIEASVLPRLNLADFLREHLKLTGTHVGCEHGVCGACTVRVNGDIVRSCLLLRALKEKGITVALSASPGGDIANFGLRPIHLETALLEVSRYLLISGIRLAYGGHLGSDGYTVRLADLLRDPIVAHLRGVPLDHNAVNSPQLVNYLPWPTFETVHAQARLGPLVEIVLCKRPLDVDKSLDPLLTDPVRQEVPVDTAIRRFAWARGLTEMRNRQVGEINARVVLGGRVGSASDGYRGRIPGVLEEVLLSIAARKPVYLVGAYGGCARIICEALEGRCNPPLTWEYHRVVPFVEELRDLYSKKSIPWEDYVSILGGLLGFD